MKFGSQFIDYELISLWLPSQMIWFSSPQKKKHFSIKRTKAIQNQAYVGLLMSRLDLLKSIYILFFRHIATVSHITKTLQLFSHIQ